MEFFSTNHLAKGISFPQAIFEGFSPGGGLYVPESFPQLPLEDMMGMSLAEVSTFILERIFGQPMKDIADKAMFPVPLTAFDENSWCLELFHGPTLSFKDFGARFLAGFVEKFKKPGDPIDILVATSGDTGSAVGQAFLGMKDVRVFILFAKGRVTAAQEQQLTTIGGNVQALEVDGTFDDCQRLLRAALQDPRLTSKRIITTGNSINVGRILPQAFYYVYAYCQLGRPFTVSVPSGNFGHLVSGLFAKRMGVPIKHVLAATNINDEVPLFLKTGVYQPHESYPTVAISMDVGNPSNFSRLMALYEGSLEALRKDVIGYRYSDKEIVRAITAVYETKGLILDPHTAISYLALKEYQKERGSLGVFLATAHPAKFLSVLPMKDEVLVPEVLIAAQKKTPYKLRIKSDLNQLVKLLV